MNPLRRFGTGIAGVVMTLSALLLAFFAGLYGIMSSPQPVENALAGSGIYTQLERTFMTQKETSLPPELAGDANVQQLLEQSVSSSFLQQSSHQILTNLYSWMQGATATPNLAINISSIKNSFSDSLSTYLQQKIEALPSCSTFVEPPQSLEALVSLSCKPLGVDKNTIATTVHQGVLDSNLLGVDNMVGVDEFVNSQRQTLTQQIAAVPVFYHYYMTSLYALPIVLVLCALAITFWSQTRRMGLKRVAWISINTGIISSVFAFSSAWILGVINQLLGGNSIQGSIISIAEALAGDVRGWWLACGVAFMFVGIVILIVLYVTRNKVMGKQSSVTFHPPQDVSQTVVDHKK